ncbi:MAG: Fic family protein [Leptotrichiaceae bacterium]|jgi:Fic family protein|nr:Fic family protein [Leptotrichiaceae bacterium]MBP7026565.1 Fic family protein [Leptotrichiaceae bacterium]MBP9876126.1 Fic family protein [Leptotrichiaceae bacterium]
MIYIGKNRALGIAIKLREQIIYDLSKSEGSILTLSETMVVIEGYTVEGGRVRDVELVSALRDAYDEMFYLVRDNGFQVDKETICLVNRIVARNENHDNIGNFRKSGIAITGTTHKGTSVKDFGIKYIEIIDRFNENKLEDKAIDLFLDIAKTQFFGDGNKRTGQLMMNGILIGEGYCPVVLNFRENKERRDKLIHFYETDDREPLKKIILEKQREFEIDFGINQD